MLCRNHVDVSEGVRRCSRCGATFCRDCLVDIQGLPYCATCKTEQLMDVRSGVDMTVLNYAGVGKRFAAIFIDGLIVIMPLYLIFLAAVMIPSSQGGEPNWLIAAPAYALMLFGMPVYEALMFSKRNGQTIGKSVMKVRVVRADGTPLTNGQCWGRAFGKMLMNCIGILDYLPAIFTKEKTTLHDMIATTRVVDAY
ncbi:MAG: RDD family protein [Thermoanaerobaculia bacterium]